MKQTLPNLSPRIAEAVLELPPPPDEERSVSLTPRQLREGMVLAEDVVTRDGLMILRRARRLTGAVIEKLHCHEDGERVFRPIRVVETATHAEPELAYV